MKRWQIALLVLLGIVVITGAGYLGYRGQSQPKDELETEEVPPTVEVIKGDVKQTIISPGQLVNYQTVILSAGASGNVTEVHVRAGDIVEEGDILIRIGTEAQLELEQAQALELIAEAQQDVINAKYEVSSLNAAPNEVDTAAAIAQVTILAKVLEEAEEQYEPFRNKPDDDIHKAQAQAIWANAQSAYDDAVRTLNYLTGTPSDPTQLNAEAELAAAEANLQINQAAYDALIDAMLITAPFDGTILDLTVYLGEAVADGRNVIQMSDPHALEVMVSVVEENYPLVMAGQPVDLYFDTAPDVITSGEVDRIVPKRDSDSLPLYPVYISIDDVPEMLVDGMTADAEIILAQKKDVLVLPRALVQANTDNTATVLVWKGIHTEERSITVGLRGDVYIEILSGLEKGEQVVGQ